MKKLHILIPSLVATASMPFIGLVGCNPVHPDPEKETEFTPSTGQMSSSTEATFEIDWTNGHSLTFAGDWEFTTSASTVASITATGGDTRPQTISLSFNNEITDNITDGKLSFTYNDLTTKKDNISATVENISITKYIPPGPETHTITFSAGDHGTLEGETTVTVEGNETKFGDIVKPKVVADEAHGWFFTSWDCDDETIITGDMPVVAQYQDLSDYVIDMDKIESIIGMEGVQYLQIDGSQTHISPMDIKNSTKIANVHSEFSPTVYHQQQSVKTQTTTDYDELYVYEQVNDPVYYKISRDDPEGTFTEPEEASSVEFFTAQLYGYSIVLYYWMFISYGGQLSFDIDNLCYKGEAVDPTVDMSIEFYFYKNQLIKFKMVSIGETINEEPQDIIEMSFTYNEITPDVPV